MILIITHKEDYTCDYIINILNDRKIAYKRLNCEDIDVKKFYVNNELKFIYEDIQKFSSVWFRRTKLPELKNLNFEHRVYLYNEYEALLKNLFTLIDCKWISDPFSVYRAENKLLQLKLAKKNGFLIPKTLVTNSKKELINFYNNNNQDIIIKPISLSRITTELETNFIFTNKIDKSHIEQLEEFDLTPCIYQNRIEKDIELRITVVGNNVFSAYVDSQSNDITKTDWRKEQLSFYPIDIPEFIKLQCIQLLKDLNLKFGAIDLIKDVNGNYVFLEINPNGQWVWIETETKLPISEALINELS